MFALVDDQQILLNNSSGRVCGSHDVGTTSACTSVRHQLARMLTSTSQEKLLNTYVLV
jgi:hypothetical protein